jgi:DNA-binding protein Fis
VESFNLQEVEKALIIKALDKCEGNRTEAAKLLGISRRTLHRKLNEYQLD